MIKVVLAEDMHIVRAAIVALLELEKDIEVVADVSSGDEILETVRTFRPDVAVIDIDLPGIDGITASRKLHEELPATRTLLLTSLGRPGTVRKALAAKVGGFIMKDAPPGELVNAIREVAAGRRYIDSQLAMSAWEDNGCPLTERELDVLGNVAKGASLEEIAAELFLSIGTVRNYLASAVTKLNARNRVDAIRIAEAADWL
ncbi:response regulator transcription factor [Actinocorallia populi]|uniref:response regulator transcription factor n=1 Tax=Actinocorallia populi TaxID=2079200 RepID=UPI000D093C90|nr:response regulator transcription factor [Actinocorallia populi]